MAQTGYTPIQLYYSSTTTNTPSAGNLANGELAINIADGKLFYKDGIGWMDKATISKPQRLGLRLYPALECIEFVYSVQHANNQIKLKCYYSKINTYHIIGSSYAK